MSNKTKKKVILNKQGLLQRLDLLGYEAYKKQLDLEDKITEQPINKMSINVVRLDYILPLPILLYSFNIHQKIQYEEMNRNKDEELAYIKLENMDAAYASNNYTLIDYTVIPFNPNFDGIMTKKALIDAVEEYNKLYEEGQKQLFGSITSLPAASDRSDRSNTSDTSHSSYKNAESDTSDASYKSAESNKSSGISSLDYDPLKYVYEIPKWILKKNKRKKKLLKEIKKKGLKKLEKIFINKDVDIKKLIDKFPGHEKYFVIEDNDKEGFITLRYTGDEPTIITEIKKLNNQPVMEYRQSYEEEEEYDHKNDGKLKFELKNVKRRERRERRRKSKKKDESKKKDKSKKRKGTLKIINVLVDGSGKKTKKEKTKKRENKKKENKKIKYLQYFK